jgi:hypothetical protein
MHLHCDTLNNDQKPFKLPNKEDPPDDDVRAHSTAAASLPARSQPPPPLLQLEAHVRGAEDISGAGFCHRATREFGLTPLLLLLLLLLLLRCPQDNRREVNVCSAATRFKIVPVASWQDIQCVQPSSAEDDTTCRCRFPAPTYCRSSLWLCCCRHVIDLGPYLLWAVVVWHTT